MGIGWVEPYAALSGIPFAPGFSVDELLTESRRPSHFAAFRYWGGINRRADGTPKNPESTSPTSDADVSYRKHARRSCSWASCHHSCRLSRTGRNIVNSRVMLVEKDPPCRWVRSLRQNAADLQLGCEQVAIGDDQTRVGDERLDRRVERTANRNLPPSSPVAHLRKYASVLIAAVAEGYVTNEYNACHLEVTRMADWNLRGVVYIRAGRSTRSQDGVGVRIYAQQVCAYCELHGIAP